LAAAARADVNLVTRGTAGVCHDAPPFRRIYPERLRGRGTGLRALHAVAGPASVGWGHAGIFARVPIPGGGRGYPSLPGGTDGPASGRRAVRMLGAHQSCADDRSSWKSPPLVPECAQPVPAGLAARAEGAEAAGQTAVWAGWDGRARGVFVVSDTVKPASAEAIARLRGIGLPPVLLTGDNTRAANAVAAQAGIDEVIAQVLSAGKVDVIKRLQDAGRVVAMVGDGVNDAAALAQADLGLAMGTGADAAIEASDPTLVRGDLRAVPDAIGLSRRTLRTIKGNLFWAFAYNAAAIPLAAFGLLNPLIAGAAMAFSSVFAVSNSLRLRRFRPGR
jgi:P-type Cu+ transporter